MQSAELAQAMLTAFSSGHPGAVESALNYFDTINIMAVEQRHPYLGKPLFAALLPLILQAAKYPDGFTDWESCQATNEDEFHRYRYICPLPLPL